MASTTSVGRAPSSALPATAPRQTNATVQTMEPRMAMDATTSAFFEPGSTRAISCATAAEGSLLVPMLPVRNAS